MNKKCIFLDIDGTVRDPFYGTPDSAMKAIRQAQKNGHLAVICTGRSTGLIPDDFSTAEFDGIIAGGGCYVEKNGEVVLDKEMDPLKVKDICQQLRSHGILHRVETKSSVYMEPEMADMLGFLGEKANNSNSEIKQMIARRNKFELRYTIDDFLKTPVPGTKICTISSPEKLDTIKEIFGSDFNIISHIDSQSNTMNTEIVQAGCDKGSGIKLFCHRFDIDIKDTVAFGDSMNDIDMFNTAALTVAMGNGEQALKDKADIVCGDILNDGLYNGFVKAGLI